MTTLTSPRFAELLAVLHQDAERSDRDHVAEMMAAIEAPGASIDTVVADLLAQERADYPATYRARAGNFLAVSADYGRFLYAMARACGARRIVEFGTSMGISTLYLAAALRDNGGGTLIGSEMEPAKVARAEDHLERAGLSDLAEIRTGDALETLRDVGGTVDLLLIDGAFSLYLLVLKLVEPHLRPGSVVVAENAFDPDYRNHVRDSRNGYVSLALPDSRRGNDFAVRLA